MVFLQSVVKVLIHINIKFDQNQNDIWVEIELNQKHCINALTKSANILGKKVNKPHGVMIGFFPIAYFFQRQTPDCWYCGMFKVIEGLLIDTPEILEHPDLFQMLIISEFL